MATGFGVIALDAQETPPYAAAVLSTTSVRPRRSGTPHSDPPGCGGADTGFGAGAVTAGPCGPVSEALIIDRSGGVAYTPRFPLAWISQTRAVHRG